MKKTKMLNFFLGTIILISASNVYAGVKLGDIDVASDDRMLFTAEKKVPGVAEYKSLYCTKLGDEKIVSRPVLLTCFPERMELLDGGKILQIMNSDGLSRYEISAGKMIGVSGETKKNLHVFPIAPSPDGKWYCTFESLKKASGNLVLVNSKTLLKKTLVENIDLDNSKIKVKWSPDGKSFLYENKNSIYFAFPDAISKNLQVNESFRKIGDGSIESVQWTRTKKIIYLENDVVYSIGQDEFYVRGLYSSLVGKGKIIARLPMEFNGLTDRFWCNEDGSRFAVISRSSILSVYSLDENSLKGNAKVDMICSLPEDSENSFGHEIFWNVDGKALLWIENVHSANNEKFGTIYSAEENMTVLSSARKSMAPVLSPDGKKIAYTDDGILKIFDFAKMVETEIYNDDSVVSVVWNGKKSIYVGGLHATVGLNLFTHETKLLFLSSVDRAFWNAGKIIAEIPGKNKFAYYDAEKNVWVQHKMPSSEFTSMDRNGKYRAYIEKALNKKFDSTILVRCLSGKTFTYSVFPESMELSSGKKKVALAFDAEKNSDGLGKILAVLSDYGVKGTFFINGEFIRRYPEKARMIANSGYECGSLFYACTDLTENNFVVDSTFITRGLARNEDEFFSVTGKELSLLWHAPEYHDNELIRKSGESAGYEYVSAFSKFTDRTTYEKAIEKKEGYKSSSEIIDCIVEELHDGMIIPVSVGKADGTRKDYLYEKIDLLILSILEKGYEITDVRGLK